MGTYIITYDLNKETKRPPLLKDIKDTFPDWAQLSESSYAVSTSWIPSQIFGHLEKHLDGNDTLYVITLRRPYAGRGPKEVNDWLNKHLT